MAKTFEFVLHFVRCNTVTYSVTVNTVKYSVTVSPNEIIIIYFIYLFILNLFQTASTSTRSIVTVND